MTTPLNPAGVGHTPGPWEMQDDHQGIWIDSPSLGCGGIAYTANYCGNEQRLANARLIAAAPDLLEACRLLVLYDERDDDGPNAGIQMMVDYDAALSAARAAISRATGDA